jgi:branched-subunit amino acid transport protein
MSVWVWVALAGVLTFLIRLSMLMFVRADALPGLVREGLRFVTPAVLTAIAVPAVLYVGEQARFDAGPGNERLPAALMAAIISWFTRSVWLTIGAGMGALWLLEWLT